MAVEKKMRRLLPQLFNSRYVMARFLETGSTKQTKFVWANEKAPSKRIIGQAGKK